MTNIKANILISVPTSPAHPYVHKLVCFTTDRMLMDGRYNVTIIRPSWNPYENNLHKIVVDFIKGHWQFWLNIDADNPPIKNPLGLVELNRDVIGLPTPVWHHTGKEKIGERPYYWNAYDYVPDEDAYKEHEPKEGLQKVDAVGTGCVLFSKRVFLDPEMQTGCFTRKLNPDGTVNKGNDISFSERARGLGFNIYAHYDYPCMHFNNLELTEVVGAFDNLYRKEVEDA